MVVVTTSFTCMVFLDMESQTCCTEDKPELNTSGATIRSASCLRNSTISEMFSRSESDHGPSPSQGKHEHRLDLMTLGTNSKKVFGTQPWKVCCIRMLGERSRHCHLVSSYAIGGGILGCTSEAVNTHRGKPDPNCCGHAGFAL